MQFDSSCGLFNLFIVVKATEDNPAGGMGRRNGYRNDKVKTYIAGRSGRNYSLHFDVENYLSSPDYDVACLSGFPDLSVRLVLNGVIIEESAWRLSARDSEDIRTFDCILFADNPSQRIIFSEAEHVRARPSNVASITGTLAIEVRRLRITTIGYCPSSTKLFQVATLPELLTAVPPSPNLYPCMISCHPSDAARTCYRKIALKTTTVLGNRRARVDRFNDQGFENEDEEDGAVEGDDDYGVQTRGNETDGENDEEDEQVVLDQMQGLMVKLQSIRTKKNSTREGRKRKRSDAHDDDDEDDKLTVRRKVERMRRKRSDVVGHADLDRDD